MGWAIYYDCSSSWPYRVRFNGRFVTCASTYWGARFAVWRRREWKNYNDVIKEFLIWSDNAKE